MLKNRLFVLVISAILVVAFSSCGMNAQKNADKNKAATENVISDELHQAQCDLLAKANEELAGINQKVRDLNTKIRDEGKKLSAAQNSALDTFEIKQASINKRMHEIKTIKQEDWDGFKTTFETDLEDVKSIIDEVLAGF